MPDWAAYVREHLHLPNAPPEREAEIVDEIAQQLGDAYQESLRQGLSEAEAEASATAHITDWESLSAALRYSPSAQTPLLDRMADRAAEHRTSGSRIRQFMISLWSDVIYGLRLLEKNPGFALAAIATLAIGIGANTAVFSVIDSTLFFRLPYPNPGRIVTAGMHNEFTFRSWVRRNKTLAAMSADIEAEMTLTGAGTAERLMTARVTSGFFPVLGIQPMLGRAFLRSETRAGGADVAILTHGLWRTRFGANPKVIGRPIHLDDKLYTIVGVMPKGFKFPLGYNPSPSVLLPLKRFSTLVLGPKGNVVSVSFQMADVLGRLKPGISQAEAQANLRVIAQATRLSQNGKKANVISLHDFLIGNDRPRILIFWGAVGFLLLIACVNVANLVLARAQAREKEIALRLALGAHRQRLARQLFTENVLLAGLGGLAGIAVAYALVIPMRNLGPSYIPRLRQATINLPVLAFTIAIAALAGILAGLVPVRAAWKLSTAETLKEGGAAGLGRSHRRLRSGLIVMEVAMAMVLLVGAGLLARSFLRLTGVPVHFDPHNLLTAQVALPRAQYASPERQRQFEHALLAGIRGLPGVASAATAGDIYKPTLGPVNFSSLQIEGHPVPGGFQVMGTGFLVASSGLFRTAGIRILEGRGFQPTDTATSQQVAVVNQAFLRLLLPHIEPLGQKIRRSSNEEWATIVGVVANTFERPVVYLPYAQHPTASLTLLIRTRGNPLAIMPALRTQVEELDSNLPVFQVATMDHLLGEQVANPRFNTLLLGVFAFVGLLLAALGVYGVVSYSVSERTHEIGIRMAMGAEKSSVLRMIVGRTLLLGLLGVGIGIGGALALTRYLQSLLYQIRPDDPLTFALAAAVLLAAALLASVLPARRATEVDPITALRYE